MGRLKELLRKRTEKSLVLHILTVLTIDAILGLSLPGWTGISILGKMFFSALKAIAIGFIIGVVQDSLETPMNSCADVFFTATAEYYDHLKHPKI